MLMILRILIKQETDELMGTKLWPSKSINSGFQEKKYPAFSNERDGEMISTGEKE